MSYNSKQSSGLVTNTDAKTLSFTSCCGKFSQVLAVGTLSVSLFSALPTEHP